MILPIIAFMLSLVAFGINIYNYIVLKRFYKERERREPKGFVADEWYRDTFGENNGK